jgi:hypothetical protein
MNYQNSYTGQSARHTGDINLASALMAVGIPLLTHDPVRVIVSATGQYASWHVGEASEDGKNLTEIMMRHWSNGDALPDDHPFSLICRFTKGKPPGRLNAGEWLDYAVQYIQDLGHELPGLRGYYDIPYFVEKLPDQPQSYILAFIENRRVCLDLYHNARRATYHRSGDSDDSSHALIDANLPAWKKQELLSRLQG